MVKAAINAFTARGHRFWRVQVRIFTVFWTVVMKKSIDLVGKKFDDRSKSSHRCIVQYVSANWWGYACFWRVLLFLEGLAYIFFHILLQKFGKSGVSADVFRGRFHKHAKKNLSQIFFVSCYDAYKRPSNCFTNDSASKIHEVHASFSVYRSFLITL